MRKKLHRIILGFAVLVLFSCGSNTTKVKHTQSKILISGSSTMSGLLTELAVAYNKDKADLEILIHQTGSGKGLFQLKKDEVNIAMLSQSIEDSNLDTNEYTILKIARDGVLPAVSAQVYEKVKALSLAEIKMIYNGEVTNWKSFSGIDAPIYVVDKIHDSGTRRVYMKKLFGKANASANGADEIASTTEKEAQLIEESNVAFGMLSSGWLNEHIKGLSIITDKGLVKPIKENIESGIYPIVRPLYIAYSKNTDANTKSFVNFINSEAGKQIIKTAGYSLGDE